MRLRDWIPIVAMALLLGGCAGFGDDEEPPGHKETTPTQSTPSEPTPPARYSDAPDHTAHSRTVVKMRKSSGIYKVPVVVNGVEMEFIFDTGASLISISDVEAAFLYKQGSISRADFLGSERFLDATGRISEGAIVNLHSITIGNRTIYNVRASVTHTAKAPLLLGQSVLQQFGTITIDYNNLEIIFD